MLLIRRRSLSIAALAGSFGVGGISRSLFAQEAAYPARAVTTVVPWPAGGPTDAFARVLAARLGSDLGQPFPVDNRGGASGTIGAASVARARPDGHTVMITPNSTYAMAPHLYQLPYDQERAFTPVGLLASSPLFMVVHRDSPVRSLADYVALAKRPGSRETYANAGSGSSAHLATEMFLQRAGIEVTDVGYRGGGPATQGLLTKEVGMLFLPAASLMAYIQSGEFRAIAATTPERSSLAPEVPTIAESGFPGYEVIEHVAMFVPAGTPGAIVQRLNRACRAALEAPDMQGRLTTLAVLPTVQTPEEWPAYFAAESAKWREVIRSRNIRVQ